MSRKWTSRKEGNTVNVEDGDEEEEDMTHFVLRCNKLQWIRIEINELQRPVMENEDIVVGQFVFEGEEEMIYCKMKTVEKMWMERKKIYER